MCVCVCVCVDKGCMCVCVCVGKGCMCVCVCVCECVRVPGAVSAYPIKAHSSSDPGFPR